MSKREAHLYLVNLASRLKVDLGESGIEATKKILSKGKPLSAIVRERCEVRSITSRKLFNL